MNEIPGLIGTCTFIEYETRWQNVYKKKKKESVAISGGFHARKTDDGRFWENEFLLRALIRMRAQKEKRMASLENWLTVADVLLFLLGTSYRI